MARIPASILRIGVEGETLLEALPRMREAYCGTIAYQIEHLASHQQRMWLREMIETGAHRTPLTAEEKQGLVSRLIEVFQFERFLEKAYLGQKMFSIEGLDVVVPMLDELVTLARRSGAEEVILGMAHRGRLSVLTHNLGRPVESILAEFEAAKALEQVKAIAAIPHSGTGDVKYHHGAEGIFSTRDGEEIKVRLYPNPSHLEFVDPVVTGGARAEQTSHSGPVLHHTASIAVPLLLHGDAAFPGQGVVAETLNLQSLEGYSTGGTVHIITNNQVGFTTDPEDDRSTPYAADLAKGFNVPIIHVNADDVEACIAAIRLAMAYRERWGRDVVIDLIGYRRFGHNETDEPAYTQPQMAAKIKAHPPVSEIYAEQLVKEGVISAEDIAEEGTTRQAELSAMHKDLRRKMEAGEYEDPSSTAIQTGELDRTKSPEVETHVSEKRLRSLNEELLKVPESFTIHRKLRKPLMKRLEVLDDGPIEWGHAEALAFASLLTEGTHIRLTGQDTERGTFSHRHMALHDEKTGIKYVPIQKLSGALAPMELHNSPLSEIACLGFEYGYSAASPESLILWEAQFGDFANSAQVIIDQFITSGEAKWGQTTRLTLLLPHGYEGSGPRALERPHRALHPAGVRGQHPAREPHDRRAVLPPDPPPGPDREAAATHRLHAEGPAAPAGRGLEARRPHRGDVPVRDGRPVRALGTRRDRAARALQRQGLLRHHRTRGARAGHGQGRDRPRRAPLPVRARPDQRAHRELPQPQADHLGPGRAEEHGRLERDGPPHARARPRGRGASLRRTAPTGSPLRGLPDRPPPRAGADRAHGARGGSLPASWRVVPAIRG